LARAFLRSAEICSFVRRSGGIFFPFSALVTSGRRVAPRSLRARGVQLKQQHAAALAAASKCSAPRHLRHHLRHRPASPGWGAPTIFGCLNIFSASAIFSETTVTRAQVLAAQAFIRKHYPNTPVFGHGEVNPGHNTRRENIGQERRGFHGRESSSRESRPGGGRVTPMPNPPEIATIIINGQQFSYWQSVVVERSYGQLPSYATFENAELGPLTQGFQGLRIGPGDTGSVTLAGQPALTNGIVDLRQVYADRGQHQVQIRLFSLAQNAVVSTVKAAPGQYTNSTFQQIAQAAAKAVGVNVKVAGNPPGADKVFERVSERAGETIWAFMERLARWRDLHVTDDVNGNIVFTRGGTGGAVAALVEGQNILKARAILENNHLVEKIDVNTQNFGNNTHWGPDCVSSATAQNPTPLTGIGALRSATLVGEEMGANVDCQLRANHELALMNLTSCEITVTVPGWLMPSGALWISLIGGPPQQVTLTQRPNSVVVPSSVDCICFTDLT
jgi:prophage tail gpP-like protein